VKGRRGVTRSYTGRKKSADQPRHAKERLESRFGIFMTLAEIERLAVHIRNAGHAGRNEDGSIEFMLKQSNTRKWWRVRIGEQTAIAVFDKTTQGIATFITEEMAARWQPAKGWSEDD